MTIACQWCRGNGVLICEWAARKTAKCCVSANDFPINAQRKFLYRCSIHALCLMAEDILQQESLIESQLETYGSQVSVLNVDVWVP